LNLDSLFITSLDARNTAQFKNFDWLLPFKVFTLIYTYKSEKKQAKVQQPGVSKR